MTLLCHGSDVFHAVETGGKYRNVACLFVFLALKMTRWRESKGDQQFSDFPISSVSS